jgi:uncharacterized protein YmfQ (DUF2313 family)
MAITALTAGDYLVQLQALLPAGPAWSREAQDSITGLLQSWADEFARIDGRAFDLLREADPQSTSELLTDWERVAGLPDPCVANSDIPQTLAQRQTALVSRLAMQGGQSPAYFIALLAAMGFAITITEIVPHTTEHDTEHAVWGEADIYAWYVNASLATLWELTTEDNTELATALWSNVPLECLISRIKPAHTTVIFSYT